MSRNKRVSVTAAMNIAHKAAMNVARHMVGRLYSDSGLSFATSKIYSISGHDGYEWMNVSVQFFPHSSLDGLDQIPNHMNEYTVILRRQEDSNPGGWAVITVEYVSDENHPCSIQYLPNKMASGIDFGFEHLVQKTAQEFVRIIQGVMWEKFNKWEGSSFPPPLANAELQALNLAFVFEEIDDESVVAYLDSGHFNILINMRTLNYNISPWYGGFGVYSFSCVVKGESDDKTLIHVFSFDKESDGWDYELKEA